MKKLLLLAFAFPFFANTQITLNDTCFTGANKSYIFSTLTDLGIDYSTTGANILWNFDTLVATDQKPFITKPISQAGTLSQLFFGSFANVNYQATYFASTTDIPLAQLTQALPITIEDMSLFTKKTTSAINSVGYELKINGTGVGVKSDTIETRYALPLNYGDTYDSRGYTELDMNPIYDAIWRQHRTRNSSVDGWGTVITPFGSFPCLRIHHIITENDSIRISLPVIGATWLPLQVPVAHEYEWKSTADKEVILRIRTNEILGNEIVTAIEFRDDYNGLDIENKSIEMTIFPNPAVNELKVQSSSSVSEYVVFDKVGAIYLSEKVDASKDFKIDVSHLPQGQFTLLINTTEGIKSIEFQK